MSRLRSFKVIEIEVRGGERKRKNWRTRFGREEDDPWKSSYTGTGR